VLGIPSLEKKTLKNYVVEVSFHFAFSVFYFSSKVHRKLPKIVKIPSKYHKSKINSKKLIFNYNPHL